MNSKPKIVVLKLRELIYTLMLLFLVVLLVICLFLMFSGKARKNDSAQSTENTAQNQSAAQSTENTAQSQSAENASQSQSAAQSTEDTAQNLLETAGYQAGIYTTSVTLGDSAVDVEVTVDSDHINAIRLVNLSESTAAAYPLVSPSLEHIASQILETQSLENITCPQENRYTSQLLLSAIREALDRARDDF